MTDDIQKLIASLRLGDHEDPSERIALLSAALVDANADLAFLSTLLRARQVPLCLAALDAVKNRPEPEVGAELARLVASKEVRIRQKLAEVLSSREDRASIEALRKLAGDSETDIRVAAVEAMKSRPVFREIQEQMAVLDKSDYVKCAAVNALDGQDDPNVARVLGQVLHSEDDWNLWRRCADGIERRLREKPAETEACLPEEISQLTAIGTQLKTHGSERFPLISAWLKSRIETKVDVAAIGQFGTDLTALSEKGALTPAYLIDDSCEMVLKHLRQDPPRSIALLGPAGVGKSALVHRLTSILAQPEYGWRVIRVSPSDFMSGTKYLGEWETKVRDLVEAIRRPRRVLLYIPNLSDLSAAGTWSKSDSNVATALAPYIDDGSVVVLGESTVEEFEKGLGKIPSLRRLFDKVLLQEPDMSRTSRILAAIRDDEGSLISDELLVQLMEVSTQFLSHISRPGNAVELLRAAIKVEKGTGRVVSFRNILDALSRSTGIPASLLDDAIPLHQDETQSFFEGKIIGQPKAIEAMIDLVTLIKAGVTDPNRPFGVFMFVGPTGVGKTELARALAEFIFGDPNRLKRYDMSEYANQEGFTRLIGTPFENGLLTDAVRQQPFSVVLLDEIEKSNINVFDLCLQIFDAGRLTDGRGRTVDFRRTIIILTSNVGATAGTMGFGATSSSRGSKPSKETVPTELSRFFRPEFLNRLDRIIQFEPLSLEVAEQIARKEIQSALQRSGIRRREIAVEVDAGVVSQVVKEGYSPRYGARPLKRTVEKLVLLPVAKAISSGSLQKGSIFRVSLHSGRIKVTTTAAHPPEVLREKVPATQIRGSQKLTELRARYAQLQNPVSEMSRRKSELILQTHEPSFSRDHDRRTTVLNDIHSIDEFLSLHDAVGNALRTVQDTVRREELERLQREVHHLSFVAQCQDARSLGDALVTISLVRRTGEPQDSIQKIAAMYQGLAQRRRLTAEVLGERYHGDHDHAYVLVAGLGAYGLLKREAGLHQVDRRYKVRASRSSREVLKEDRELVRVEIRPASREPSSQFQKEVRAKISALKPVRKRLLTAEYSLSLFHEPSLRSTDFWTSGPKDVAVARGVLVLSVGVEANGEPSGSEGIIRQYDLGLAAKIKDHRTGRVTTRVDLVLKGDLDTLAETDSISF